MIEIVLILGGVSGDPVASFEAPSLPMPGDLLSIQVYRGGPTPDQAQELTTIYRVLPMPRIWGVREMIGDDTGTVRRVAVPVVVA